MINAADALVGRQSQCSILIDEELIVAYGQMFNGFAVAIPAAVNGRAVYSKRGQSKAYNKGRVSR